MSFFESLLVLLLLSIALLQVSRRLGLPYPAMLAASGMLVALVPGAPEITLDPAMALALFIAPTLLDAAYDFPATLARRFWPPLLVLAAGGVLLTAFLVAWLGVHYAGLPLPAALVLGAIVAPPDAVAATAVLSGLSVPANTEAVLKGESLFNDAVALLLFGGALAVQEQGGLRWIGVVHLGLAAPAGIALGIAFAFLSRLATPFTTGTLGGNLLQFVSTCLVWIVAERLGVSAVLCVVAYAMTLASTHTGASSARMRVHSYAVWATVVFLLNVLAFLFMGMQVRTILARMQTTRLDQALSFAAIVLAAVVLVRFVVVMLSNRLAAHVPAYRGHAERPSLRAGILVGWCGMRGLVTLATAFALPADFPKRDLVTLSAFAIVMGTLVLQGLTLAPLIRLLRLDRSEDAAQALSRAREALIKAGMDSLDGEDGREAMLVRKTYAARSEAEHLWADQERYRTLALGAIAAERAALLRMHRNHELDAACYDTLLEELDWRELALLPDEHRRIEES